MVNLNKIESLMDVCFIFGGCPQCAYEEGVRSDSSAVEIKEIIEKLPKSDIPVSYKGSWIYFCEEHMKKDENYESFEDIELDNGEEIRDLFENDYHKNF